MKTEHPTLTEDRLVALADACKEAEPDEQRQWLEQAFYALNEAPGYGTDEHAAWVAKSDRFHKLIRADAFLDAAMTLVPENGWLSISGPMSPAAFGFSREDNRRKRAGYDVIGPPWGSYSSGSTYALALCAAALRARAALASSSVGEDGRA